MDVVVAPAQRLHQLEGVSQAQVSSLPQRRAAGRAALALKIGGLRLQLLPLEAVAQRLALCDDVEALLAADLPAAQRARAWFDIGFALSNARPRRSLVAAQRAVQIVRSAPDGLAGSPQLLPMALCRVAVSAANLGDEAGACNAMAQVLELEQADWPLPILRKSLEAQFFVQQMLGNVAQTVQLAQRCVALDRRIGMSSKTSIIWLADAQLACGDAAASVATGRELLAQLEGSRNVQGLAYARINLAAAYLAQGDQTHARPLLEAGWAQTPVFDFMRPYFANLLALLSALDSRPDAAAWLCGYADAAYVAFEDARQPNEAAAVERARRLARAALGDAEFLRLHGEGARSSGDAAAALAFARTR